ncbi:hypothetical protein GTA08_BOTSDO01230 [Neofusicoccum parvum]|uniref:Uncharacterized protein n=1 Tax=Neofusicoccum parvum TaxID=310453 RepID=A0ACB5RZQ5_9PEZI|nr:hypothetical protein GTA08_BOTSDO01230 [Neofusicoccum parvum]
MGSRRSAKDRVLEVPDLLELILLYCPVFTLLHAQRVAHTWRHTIQASMPLQQELFFRPKPRTVNELGSTVWHYNPLLFIAFPSWFAQPRNRYHMPDVRAFEEMDWDRNPKRHKAFTRPEASWRRMLPTQPAIEVLEIVNFSHGKKMDGVSNDVAYFEDGLRMGVLYDLTEGHISRHVVSSFAAIWPTEEQVFHADISVGYHEDHADRKQREETDNPPPPPSPPQRPTPVPIKTGTHDGAIVSPEPLSTPLPSPWVIGSLVSTRVREENEKEVEPVEGAGEPEEDYYDDTDSVSDDDTDSLCGQTNYGHHVTLVLAHVQQVHPGSFPPERKWKSEGQEAVSIHIGKYRYRDHGGTWKDIETEMETIPEAKKE